jgi:hypothetical protein
MWADGGSAHIIDCHAQRCGARDCGSRIGNECKAARACCEPIESHSAFVASLSGSVTVHACRHPDSRPQTMISFSSRVADTASAADRASTAAWADQGVHNFFAAYGHGTG